MASNNEWTCPHGQRFYCGDCPEHPRLARIRKRAPEPVEPSADQIERAQAIIHGHDWTHVPVRSFAADLDYGTDEFVAVIETCDGERAEYRIDRFGKLPSERRRRYAMVVVVDAEPNSGDPAVSAWEAVTQVEGGVYASDPVEIPAEGDRDEPSYGTAVDLARADLVAFTVNRESYR